MEIILTPDRRIALAHRHARRAQLVLLALALAAPASPQTPLGTAFTYQGQLKDAGAPANGTYDFEFVLFNAPVPSPIGGDQVGSPIYVDNVTVTAGLFSVRLDFGATPFAGEARFLQIGVHKLPAPAGQYTILTGRQELTPGPNALFAASAGTVVGTVPVANGGTGLSSLPLNAVLFGQGASPAGAAVGSFGQVLAGSAGAPVWTASPTLNGNLNLAGSASATVGAIFKAGSRFIHNYGISNTFIGENSGNFTMTGSSNTASGALALASLTTGSQNTGVGAWALFTNTTGSDNTATGFNALVSNSSGSANTATGTNALSLNTTGGSNTATGGGALLNNSSGSFNTATGHSALLSNTVGIFNTASGYAALQNNLSGAGNTAAGYSALLNNISGAYNTAMGTQTLHNNQTGGNNTAGGFNAMVSNTQGDSNTAFGFNALSSNTSGTNNIALGAGAGLLTTGSSNIVIGTFGAAGESGVIRIGAGSQTKAFIAGIRGVSTDSVDAIAVVIDSNGQLGTISSSGRLKDDIADMADASSALMKLRPVTFHYKSDQNPAGPSLQYGLIAEEVAAVNPGLVARSKDGEIETVLYQFLAPMLLNEYQKQQRTIQAQAELLDIQTSRIADLERQTARIAGLEAAVAVLRRRSPETR